MDVLRGSERVGGEGDAHVSELMTSQQLGQRAWSRLGGPRWRRMALAPAGCWAESGVLVALVVAALLAPWLTPYAVQGAGEHDIVHKLLAPWWAHPLLTRQDGAPTCWRTRALRRAHIVGASAAGGGQQRRGWHRGGPGGWLCQAAGPTRERCARRMSFSRFPLCCWRSCW